MAKKRGSRRSKATAAARRRGAAATRRRPRALARASRKTKTKTKVKTKVKAKAKPKAKKRAAPRKAQKARKVAKAARPRRATATRRRTTRPSLASRSPKVPALGRERRTLTEEELLIPTPPSSLDLDRHPSAARSGQHELREHLQEHTETGPALTGGDIDANWETAYSSGDEAPGGDNPTPDQDIVEELGRALGVQYEDNEELKGADKIIERDRHRWELDPASSEDYKERSRKGES